MSICKLISEEIDAIQKGQLDISSLGPENYDIYLDKLNDQIKHLEKIKRVYGPDQQYIEELDYLLKNSLINIENLIFENFASKVEEIKEDTVIFFGELDFKKYEQLGHKALPSNLKFVVGTLLLNFTSIEEVELKYVSDLHAQDCNNLRSISIETINSLYLNRCPVLSSLKLLYVKSKITLIKLNQLNINSIGSIYPNQLTEFGIHCVYNGDPQFYSIIKRV